MNYSILYALCLLSHLCLGEMSFALWGYVLGWEVPYPPLHTSCNSGAVCSSQALRGQRSSSWHLKEISMSLLYLLAPAWGAQRIDGERSSWSIPSEIAAESKLVVGIREKQRNGKRETAVKQKNLSTGQRSCIGNPKQGTKTSGWTAVVETNH